MPGTDPLVASFVAGDASFPARLRACADPKSLAALASAWKGDTRAWAAAALASYLDEPLAHPGHEVLVKRLYKNAEDAGDDIAIAWFLVAFDTSIRRGAVHWGERSVLRLRLRRVGEPPAAGMPDTRTADGVPTNHRVRGGAEPLLFSVSTRRYLQRRAWRWFRNAARTRPEVVVPCLAEALSRYRDEHLADTWSLRDAWGLLHACFGDGDAVRFGQRMAWFPGTGGPTAAAPFRPDLWRAPTAASHLLRLVERARSRLVRVWAVDVLDAMHAAAPLDVAALFGLIGHDDPEVAAFAAKALDRGPGIGLVPAEAWIAALTGAAPAAAETLVAQFRRHVAPERLTLTQCVDLACAANSTVARLGLSLVAARRDLATDQVAAARLADVRSEVVGRDAAVRGLCVVGSDAGYDGLAVVRFFDAPNAGVRDGAWTWLASSAAAQADTSLWCRLAETAHDDVRERLVDALDVRAARRPVRADDLAPLWCSALLAVHRGGVQRRKSIRQMADAIEAEPATALQLLPVLVTAVRSIRGPDRRAGISAVVRLVTRVPTLGPAVTSALPELRIEESAPCG